MLSEKVIGRITDNQFLNKAVDYVDLEWHEAYKRLHRKKTRDGNEIGIRLGNDILTRGLRQEDVIYEANDYIVAVNIRPCRMIVVDISRDHPEMLGKVCYEIGNRHAALFWGSSHLQVRTPYNHPMLEHLRKMHGVTCHVKEAVPDFSRSISASINDHSH